MRTLSWIDANETRLMLDGSEGVSVQRGASGLDSPATRNSIDQRVGSDGAVRIMTRSPERAVTLPLLIDVDTISEAEVVRRMQSGTLVAESGYGQRQLRNCVYDSGFEGAWSVDTGGVTGMTHRKFTVTLLALDPWWTDTDLSAVVLPLVASTSWNPALSWSPAIPWNGGSSYQADIEGDGGAYPDFYVRGPFTTLTVSIAGLGWSLAGPLADGIELTVTADPQTQAATGGRGPKLASDSLVDWSLLSENSRMPILPVGSPSVIVGATGTGANSACWMFWVGRWLTP